MAERWQQWMPHDIDAWQGSANVQALSDLAYRAAHNLILDMWKQADCALPADDRELAKRSRVMGRWAECRDEVLEYFTDRTADGKITHRVTLKKWNDAREVYEKRQTAAKRTNALRSAHGDRDGDRDAQPTHEQVQGQEQVQKQVQKQKPSRSRELKPPDSRHTGFKDAFTAYFAYKNRGLSAPWDEQEAAQLARFLRKNPGFTGDQWKKLLKNRAGSPVPHGESLSTWITRALIWANGTTDAHGKSGGFNGKPTITDSISAKQAVLDARRTRGVADEPDRGGGSDQTGLARLGPGSEQPAAGLVL